jgi:uncharacterized membrane protein YgcG
MKNLFILIAAFLWLNVNAQNIPEHKSNTYINDFANVIDDSQEPILDKKIRDFKAKSSIEMTVVSITSLDGSDIDSYSNALFRKWGIGTSQLNNGLLILFSVSDRKWRIEVGDGLEEYMTDGYAKVEAKNVLVPYFKQKDYFSGVNALVDDFITKLGPLSWDERNALKAKQAEIAAKEAQDSKDAMVSFFTWFSIFVIAGLGIFLYVRNEIKKKRKLEEEAREQKMKLEALVSENNTAINYFSKMSQWAKENKDLFKSGLYARAVNFEDFDAAKNKLTDLLAQRNLSIEYLESEKLLIRNTSKELLDKIKDVYVAYTKMKALKSSIQEASSQSNGYKTSVNNTDTKHKRALSTFGIAVLDISFPQAMLINKLNTVDSTLSRLNSMSALDDLSSMQKDFAQVKTSLRDVSTQIDMVNKRIDSINSAVQYVSSNRGKINTLLNEAQYKVKDSDVEYSTKSKFNTVKAKAEMFRENPNPLIAYTEMSTLINDLNSVIKRAKDDISDAERERENENERRRKAAEAAALISSTSSSSSYSSTTSSNDTTSFGGGSSSGGGASGDW